MKKLLKLALIPVLSFVLLPIDAPAENAEAPAAEKPKAEKVELTGKIYKEAGKFKLKTADKKYLITGNNDEKVTPFVDKKVKIVGKVKSKLGEGGKPFHMVVYVGKIEAVTE